MAKPKRPVYQDAPSSQKHPVSEPDDPGKQRPVWRLSLMDFDGPFGWQVLTGELAKTIHAKLSNFEGMTWTEIERSGSHNVAKAKLAKQARDRLAKLKQDDVDELFSLRLSGKERIWGIRERSVLRLLWWDPQHEVCPSAKKAT
jgi:hypothetical protein